VNQTLHRKVTDLLLARIVSGQWPVGTRLPTEVALAADLGVSRATLRVGLADLERLGLVARRKRAGTTIIASEPRNLLQQVTGGVEDLLDIARQHRKA
jgi:DNA-binding GntR family transcriptional regulator